MNPFCRRRLAIGEAKSTSIQAVAAAKLNDAQTIEDASAWLRPRERLAVLGDRALIAVLARLPNAGERPNAA